MRAVFQTLNTERCKRTQKGVSAARLRKWIVRSVLRERIIVHLLLARRLGAACREKMREMASRRS